MDCIRSRTFCYSGAVVVALVIFSVLIYSFFKSPAVKEYADEKPLLTVSSYNPLKTEGFRRATHWGEFRTHGPLSASAADFQKDGECRRVVVFLARGTILGHILSACDSMEPSMGLLMVDDILYYYGRAMEKLAPTEDTFTMANKVVGERRCLMTNYTLSGVDRPTVERKSETLKVGNEDTDCKILLDFKMPPMLLLSQNGITGMFSPGKNASWATINPWEALGAVTRVYWYGVRCFRLLVITSYGRSVQAVKVSCGPVENLVATDNVLYYGDALVVRRNSEANTFVLVYNPKRSGNCFKKTVLLSSKEGRPVISVVSKENLSYEDKDCRYLVIKEMSGVVLTKNEVARLVTTLKDNSFGVEPYGGSLDGYTPYSQWSYFNLPMDLGFAVAYYKSKEGLSVRRLLMVVARGIPITAVLADPEPIHRLVMRAEALYYDTYIMLRKTQEDKFIAVIKIDEYNCFKKKYVLKHENGLIVKEELPSGGKVTKSMDEDCRDLIEGKKLKNPELGNFGHNTDDVGVPIYLPAGVNFSRDYARVMDKQD